MLKVPTSALFRVGDESAVFQVVDGVVRQQKVKIGRQNGLEAEILEGLTEGDRVVLHPERPDRRRRAGAPAITAGPPGPNLLLVTSVYRKGKSLLRSVSGARSAALVN